MYCTVSVSIPQNLHIGSGRLVAPCGWTYRQTDKTNQSPLSQFGERAQKMTELEYLFYVNLQRRDANAVPMSTLLLRAREASDTNNPEIFFLHS